MIGAFDACRSGNSSDHAPPSMPTFARVI